MCVVKTPKIQSDPNTTKDPAILRNPLLDGMLGNIAALQGGRNALRINLLNPLAIPVGGGAGAGIGGGNSSSSGGSSTSSSSGTSSSGGTFTNSGGSRSRGGAQAV